MKAKISLLCGMAFFLILISAPLIFSQSEVAQEQAPPQEESIVPEQLTPGSPSDLDVQWLWGEVASVDVDTKQILVNYLNYETDTETQMSISVDDKTTYENVKSIDEIKPLDALSIDYIVTQEAKNIAKNISVEKSEVLETQQKEVQEAPPVGKELKKEGEQ